jgi:hypothetical protein
LAAFPAASILLGSRRHLSKATIFSGIKSGVSTILVFAPQLDRAGSVWGHSHRFHQASIIFGLRDKRTFSVSVGKSQ